MFDFFNFFFQKTQHKVLHLEIKLILLIIRLWHLKVDPKSKDGRKVPKSDAKAGITQV